MCHSGSCSSSINCSYQVQVRCTCKRLSQQVACHEINSTNKNTYRLPCDEICAEIKKNRTPPPPPPSPPVINVPRTEEEDDVKPLSTIEISSTNRKNRKRQNNIESNKNQQQNNLTTTTTTTTITPKKSKPRRFVWTLHKALAIFGLFTLITVSLTIYMLTQI